MKAIHTRITALERKDGHGIAHCVSWYPGMQFDDALAQSHPLANCTKRLLIEHVPIGMDRNPVPLTAEQQTEQNKAHTWADGAEV